MLFFFIIILICWLFLHLKLVLQNAMHVEQSLNSDSNIKDTKFLLPCPGLKIPLEVSNSRGLCNGSITTPQHRYFSGY